MYCVCVYIYIIYTFHTYELYDLYLYTRGVEGLLNHLPLHCRKATRSPLTVMKAHAGSTRMVSKPGNLEMMEETSSKQHPAGKPKHNQQGLVWLHDLFCVWV